MDVVEAGMEPVVDIALERHDTSGEAEDQEKYCSGKPKPEVLSAGMSTVADARTGSSVT